MASASYFCGVMRISSWRAIPRGKRLAVGARADHGVEGVGQSNDAHCLRHFLAVHPVGIAGSVTAFVVPAYDFRNLRPRKMHAADDLMPDYGVVGHFAKLFRIERRRLAEQSLIHRHLANVVEISRRAQRGSLGWLHSHRFSDRLGVAADAQGMSMNVHVLHVDGGGEGFESVVVEPMQRGEQTQIFRNSMR